MTLFHIYIAAPTCSIHSDFKQEKLNSLSESLINDSSLVAETETHHNMYVLLSDAQQSNTCEFYI